MRADRPAEAPSPGRGRRGRALPQGHRRHLGSAGNTYIQRRLHQLPRHAKIDSTANWLQSRGAIAAASPAIPYAAPGIAADGEPATCYCKRDRRSIAHPGSSTRRRAYLARSGSRRGPYDPGGPRPASGSRPGPRQARRLGRAADPWRPVRPGRCASRHGPNSAVRVPTHTGAGLQSQA